MQCFLYHPVRVARRFGLLLLLLAPWHASSGQGSEGTLLIVGDSISAAYGMSLDEGWVALLARRLEQSHPGIKVVNASISGDTTDSGLRRMPALLATHQPVAVVIELGGNDALRGFKAGLIEKNLTAMAERATAAGAAVLLLPIEPPDNYGRKYLDDVAKAFASAAKTSGARLGALPFAGMKNDSSLRQADDLHPTVAAQPRILDNVWPDIEALLASP
jgi:acyl-CoA thioesterase-1